VRRAPDRHVEAVEAVPQVVERGGGDLDDGAEHGDGEALPGTGGEGGAEGVCAAAGQEKAAQGRVEKQGGPGVDGEVWWDPERLPSERRVVPDVPVHAKKPNKERGDPDRPEDLRADPDGLGYGPGPNLARGLHPSSSQTPNAATLAAAPIPYHRERAAGRNLASGCPVCHSAFYGVRRWRRGMRREAVLAAGVPVGGAVVASRSGGRRGR
jgi:hypothetical protein